MASAIPVHSSKKGKAPNGTTPSPLEQSGSKSTGSIPAHEVVGSSNVPPSEEQSSIPAGVKLDSHQAWRQDN